MYCVNYVNDMNYVNYMNYVEYVIYVNISGDEYIVIFSK